MTHAMIVSPWAVTGARAAAPPRASRATRASGARAIRTRCGYTLFDDLGHYIGTVAAATGRLTFGRGADTVLLKRGDEREAEAT